MKLQSVRIDTKIEFTVLFLVVFIQEKLPQISSILSYYIELSSMWFISLWVNRCLVSYYHFWLFLHCHSFPAMELAAMTFYFVKWFYFVIKWGNNITCNWELPSTACHKVHWRLSPPVTQCRPGYRCVAAVRFHLPPLCCTTFSPSVCGGQRPRRPRFESSGLCTALAVTQPTRRTFYKRVQAVLRPLVWILVIQPH